MERDRSRNRRARKGERAEAGGRAPGRRRGASGAFREKKTGRKSGDTRPARAAHATREKVNLRAMAATLVGEILDRNQSLKGVVQRQQAGLSRADDRALLRELVAGVVRKLPAIDWAIDECTRRGVEQTQQELLHILRVGVYQILYLDRIPAYAAVDECVEAAKGLNPGAGGFVNGILRTLAERREEFLEAPYRFAGAEAAAIRYGLPMWLVNRYDERFGEDSDAIMSALQAPAATSLVFTSDQAAAQAAAVMKREGFVLVPDGAIPRTFSVKEGNPSESEAFAQGWFYIMDPASQVPALLLPLKGGERVLDLCCAPGGKSILVAGRLSGGGWVLGTDRNARRLRQVAENVRRTGTAGIRLARVDVDQALPFRDEWPVVLLDAPCSSLGTLRRNPEIRWQTSEAALAESAAKQLRFLDQASQTVAPGGLLAYSVCSIEQEETEGVVRDFLETHPEFRLSPLKCPAWLKTLLESPSPGMAYALPHKHPWDGFFVAHLKRKGRKAG